MAATPSPSGNHRKLWITLIVICALAIIGIIIWRMIAVPD